MKPGGDAVKPAVATHPQTDVGREMTNGDYVDSGIGTTAGLAAIGLSSYVLATDAGGIEKNTICAGAAGIGTGFLLFSANRLIRGRMDDATDQRFVLAGFYTVEAGFLTVSSGMLAEGIETKSQALITLSASMIALNSFFLAYTLYDDITGVKRGRAGLLGELFRNTAVGPNGVSTAIQF